jgi:hypothetical protein
LEDLFFFDGQIPLHGKGCLWQIQSVFVIHSVTVLYV